jgi:OHCU decarboxylase
MRQKLSCDELNEMSLADFVGIIGPVFEHSPWIAESTCARRPFLDLKELYQALCDTVRAASEGQQLALIRAHPDLVGRAAAAGTLTPASTSEQVSAGLDRLSAEEVAKFRRLNEAYRDKFQFPFVICARLNKKAAILEGFRVRLENSKETEMNAALEEIFKIAWLRLVDIVKIV